MLSVDDLKIWLHRDIGRADKLMLILAAIDGSTDLKRIRETASNAGFRIPPSWNMSQALRATRGLAIRTPSGWEITEAGRQHLFNLGVSTVSPAAVQVAGDLRTHLPKIGNDSSRAFAEEAIKCFESKLYRSAIVMSWLAAVDVLYGEVIKNHLTAFNAEMQRVDSKWKAAKTADDLARIKESDFLDRLASISVIGKSVKDELQGCLRTRNGCGHPNSLKVGPNKVTSHIETLLQNVFQVFAI